MSSCWWLCWWWCIRAKTKYFQYCCCCDYLFCFILTRVLRYLVLGLKVSERWVVSCWTCLVKCTNFFCFSPFSHFVLYSSQLFSWYCYRRRPSLLNTSRLVNRYWKLNTHQSIWNTHTHTHWVRSLDQSVRQCWATIRRRLWFMYCSNSLFAHLNFSFLNTF